MKIQKSDETCPRASVSSEARKPFGRPRRRCENNITFNLKVKNWRSLTALIRFQKWKIGGLPWTRE